MSCPRHIALSLEDSELRAELCTRAMLGLILKYADSDDRDLFESEHARLIDLLGKSLYFVEYGIHALKLGVLR